MTRQDLVNKSIDKLNTVKEALELIEILEYDECIAVLTGTKNLPLHLIKAVRTCSLIRPQSRCTPERLRITKKEHDLTTTELISIVTDIMSEKSERTR